MTKGQIRTIFKKKRLELSLQEVANKSQAIADNFINNFLPKIPNFADKKIAFYISANNEVDPKPIMEYINKVGNIICLPRMSDENHNILSFKQYNINDELEKSILYPKLSEPKSDKKTINPDIVFVPLVAFDSNCNRLGMGKGFYDYTIDKIRSTTENTVFIGLAYNLQLYKKIPTEEFDQTLNFIISEDKLFASS